MRRIVIGLGSNLGDRLATLRSAARIACSEFLVRAISPVYETAPIGNTAQPAYLNAAMLLETPRTPESVLASLLAIEASFGRERRERWAARTLDLDILWIDGETFSSETLTVPHPRLNERRFALLPMLDIVPDATHPVTGAPYELPAGDVRLFAASL